MFVEFIKICLSFLFTICLIVLYCKTLEESKKIEESKIDILNSILLKLDSESLSDKNKEVNND